MSTHWIVEGQIDPRWPINTRGNIGEVFPEVLTPLTYKLAVIPAEQGWRDACKLPDADDAGAGALELAQLIRYFLQRVAQ